MKNTLLYLVIICLLTVNNLAQSQNDYSGVWELVKEKSSLDERFSKALESQTLIINQSGNLLRVEVKTKGDKSVLGPDEIAVYSIGDGFTMVEQETPNGKIPVTYEGVTEKNDLKLTQSRTSNSKVEKIILKVEDLWSLSDNKKTLTIKRKIKSNLEKTDLILIYQKTDKQPLNLVARPISEPVSTVSPPSRPKMISAGIINGKMTVSVKPSYPEEARLQKVQGTVKVKVVVDEEGKVISAEATEGEQILRKSAEEAAKASQFASIRLSGQPVKYIGIVIYQFSGN